MLPCDFLRAFLGPATTRAAQCNTKSRTDNVHRDQILKDHIVIIELQVPVVDNGCLNITKRNLTGPGRIPIFNMMHNPLSFRGIYGEAFISILV